MNCYNNLCNIENIAARHRNKLSYNDKVYERTSKCPQKNRIKNKIIWVKKIWNLYIHSGVQNVHGNEHHKETCELKKKKTAPKCTSSDFIFP